MFINFKFRIGSWISLLFPILIFGQVKETHQYIKEWIQTEQLISEEKNNWESEKATLLDLQDALIAEISELETKLEQFEKENVGAAKNRSDLSLRKEEAEETTKIFYKQIKEVEKEIKNIFPILPSPLRDQTRAFLDKINGNKSDNLPFVTVLMKQYRFSETFIAFTVLYILKDRNSALMMGNPENSVSYILG